MAFNKEINDLANCLPYLECDKATDRKKTADKIERILNMDNVMKWLTDNPQQNLTFTKIFKCVQGYLIKESDILLKKGGSISAMGETKIMHCSKLLRRAVQVANKNEPSVKCMVFVDSVIMILKEKFYCDHFAHTYLDLFITHFLKYNDCIQAISSQKYKDILLACVDLQSRASKPLLVQLFYAMKSLIKCVIQQCSSTQHQYLFMFFKDSIAAMRTESSCSILDDYLWILYNFASWQLPSACDLVADLSDITLPLVSSFLQSKKLTSTGFILTAKYCLLQVKLACDFSDCSVFSDSQAGYHKSSDVFKQMLTGLLHKLKSDYRSLGRIEPTEVNEMVELTSTLLHVFITFGDEDFLALFHELEVFPSQTQHSALSNKQFSISHIAHLSSVWQSFQSQCKWLWIIDSLVRTFPDDVSTSDVSFVLESLYEIVSNSKHEDVLSAAFQLLSSCLLTKSFKEAALSEDFCGIKLWEVSKRQAFLMKAGQHRSSQAAFEVLSILCNYEYSKCEKYDTGLVDTWPVLCLSILPSQALQDADLQSLEREECIAVLRFLSASLKRNSLIRKKSYSSDNLADDIFSLRTTLLDWLCGCTDVVLNSADCLVSQNESNKDDSQLMLKVPSLFACLFCDKVYPAEASLVAIIIEGLCSVDIVISSTLQSQSDEKDFEKIYVPALCDHACHLVHLMLDLASEILSKTNLNIKQLFALTYSIQLVASVASRFNKDLNIKSDSLKRILESMSAILDALPYHCANDVLKVLESLCEFVEFCRSFQMMTFDNFDPLYELAVSTLIWSFEYFRDYSADCSTQMSTVELTKNNSDSPRTSKGKRLHDHSFSEPPAKYNRISLDRKRIVNHQQTKFQQTDQQASVFEVSERSLLLLAGLAKLAGSSYAERVFDDVFKGNSFERTSADHVQIFLFYIKVFSAELENISWSKLHEILSDAKPILRNHYHNQVVYSKWLDTLPIFLKILTVFSDESEARECVESMLSHFGIIQKMVKSEQCNDTVRLSAINCLTEMSNLCAMEKSFLTLTKLQVCEMHLQFLTDQSMAMMRACAVTSCKLLKMADVSDASAVLFYKNILNVFNTVEERILLLLQTCKKQAQALTCVDCFLQALFNVVPYPGHAVEAQVAYKVCHFASLVHPHFRSDPRFIPLMKKVLCSGQRNSCFYVHSASLNQYLTLILFKWNSYDQFETFPYYFFKVDSLRDFLRLHANEAVSIMFINWLCNDKDPSALLNLFKPAGEVLSMFIATFLACFYSKGTSFRKQVSFSRINTFVQKLHCVSRNAHSIEDVVKKELPNTLAECLRFYQTGQEPVTLPFVVDTEGIQACFTTLLDFQANGKFIESKRKFDASSFLAYFNSSRGVLQELLLNLRGLLCSSVNHHEEMRMVQIYRYVWGLLSKYKKEKHLKELVSSTAMVTLTSRFNLILRQFSAGCKELIELGVDSVTSLSSLCVVYLDLIRLVYDDMLHSSPELLSDDWLAFHLTSCLIFAASSSAHQPRLWQLHDELHQFLSSIARDENSTSVLRLILLSSPYLATRVLHEDSTKIQTPPISVETATSVVDIIKKSANASLFLPAWSAMLEGLLQVLTRSIVALGQRSMQESFLIAAYNAVSALPMAKLEIGSELSECLRALGVVSMKKGCHWEAHADESDKHPMKQTLFSLCDAFMLEEVGKARVTLACLLSVSRCKEYRQLVQSDISSLHYHFLNSFISGTVLQPVASYKATGQNPDLLMSATGDYDRWICDVTSSLIKLCGSLYIQQFQDVCRLFPSICHHILPLVILQLLMSPHRNSTINCINEFFSASAIDERKWSCILDVVEYVRSHLIAKSCTNLQKSSRGSNKKNESIDDLSGVDFLLLSETAISCREPTTALLYLELWAGSDDVSRKQGVVQYDTRSLLERAQSTGLDGRRALSVATSAFTLLSELDALRGCHSISSSSNLTIASLSKMENNWLGALQTHDLHDSSHGEVLRCLQECGFQHVSDVYARNMEDSHDEQIEELLYKSAWQSCRWDGMLGSLNTPSSSFHKLLYINQLALHRVHPSNFKSSLSKLRSTCVNSLCRDGKRFVNLEEVRSSFVRLECIKEAEAVFRLVSDAACICSVGWMEGELGLGSCSYHDQSFLSSIRISLLSAIAQRCEGTSEEGRALETQAALYLDCIDVTNKLGRLQHSKQILQKLNGVVGRMQGGNHTWWRYKAKLQMVLLLWHQKEENYALSLLRSLLDEFQSSVSARNHSSEETLLLSSLLHTTGTWFDSLKYEGGSVIMNDYFKQSTVLLEELNSSDPNNHHCSKQLVQCHLSLAKFADRQLQEVQAYKSTQEYSDKCDYAVSTSADAKKNSYSMSKKTTIIIEKNYHIDKQELGAVERNELDFLLSAMSSYVRCLQLSDQHDALLQRICALWFDHECNDEVNSFVSESHGKIPSYKYVSLCYQLSARLSKSDSQSNYGKLIKEIVTRLAADHPHHALPIILALVNADKDEECPKPQKSCPLSAVVEAVRKRKPKLVGGNEKLMDVYIELANSDATQWRNQLMKLIDFPRSLSINRLCNPKSRMCNELRGVVIPVCELQLDKSANYRSLPDDVMLSHFEQGFKTCGGINLPKVVEAVAVSGRRKRHLVKGRDDLRQDAVMQQVFDLVNVLLTQRPTHNGISMRVYKVVPLTQQSGLVEWCENTLPLGAYLAGNPVQNQTGAHVRLRPDDFQITFCRKKLGSVARQPMEVKLKTYEEICNKLSPVFRYFCIEKFLNPQECFYARRRYTQSVAVSSMVGYMLGLGDRHVQNILIDCSTGEVIHIDLGVAFEQGRCLPTPETVPFRLSRDIVDGMGLTGVEGLFRKCCEETLTLLRTSFDVIIPVMEVLLYDPLHDWTMPPIKAQKQQAAGDGSALVSRNSDHPTNKLAARALLRVKEKLRGTETGSVLSVPGQVNMLIQQAMDPRRLCQLFAGWQPYL